MTQPVQSRDLNVAYLNLYDWENPFAYNKPATHTET